MKKPVLLTVADGNTNRNFTELSKTLNQLYDGANAKQTTATLVVGDNEITPTVINPQGRIITYQDAASSLFDKGLNTNGKWVINASIACNIRLAFF